jgi:hypothetical protein
MVEDYRINQEMNWNVNRGRRRRRRERKASALATLLAALFTIPAEGLVGGFVRPASVTGVLVFVLIALTSYRAALRVLRRE